MNTYFQIESKHCIYEGEFTTLNEAKSWIQARNIPELEEDIVNKRSYAFSIAEVVEKPYGADVISITPFDYVNGQYIFGTTIKY